MDSVQVRLTKFGRELAGSAVLRVVEGRLEYEFTAEEVKTVDRERDWLKILSKSSRDGKPLFELVLISSGEDSAAICPVCENTGWRAVPNDPHGRVTRCNCRLRNRTSSFSEQARIPQRFAECEIENFKTEKRPEETDARPLAKAKAFAREYIAKFPLEGKGLLIVGQSGCGKTHLAVAILKELIRKKAVRCLFYDFRELLRDLKSTMGKFGDEGNDGPLQTVMESDVLLLDDIGSSPASEWDRDTLNLILNKRYSEARVTILTTCLLDRPTVDFVEDQSDTTEVGLQSFEEARLAVGNNTIGDRLGDQVFTRIHQMCWKLDLQSRLSTLLDAARIPPRYADCEISTFETEFDDVEHHDSVLATARLIATTFVEDFPLHDKGLMIVGPTGSGKTHLAVGIAKELIRSKNIPCRFCEYRELVREIRASFDPKTETTELGVLRPLEQIDVLVIDDIGPTQVTAWQRDTIAYILSKRYTDNKVTIITTSLDDEPTPRYEFQDSTRIPSKQELARMVTRRRTLGEVITDQVRSRLHEVCRVINLNVPDFRTRTRSQYVSMAMQKRG